MKTKNKIKQKNDYISIANEVIDIQIQSLYFMKENFNKDFQKVVDLIVDIKGRVVVSGIGKSGLIGKKIAATLASTGTSSFFMHPSEALHGDLGMLKCEDVFICISNSGEADELLQIIEVIKKTTKVPVVSISGKKNSTMVKSSDYFLNIEVKKEACPLQLAPTSSTTSTLVMGDCLAIALMKARNFKPEDFALNHPGGSLGRKLLSKVKDKTKTKNLPIINENSSFNEIVFTITKGKLGLAVVMEQNVVKGVITDGDLRRAMLKDTFDVNNLLAKNIMTKTPKTIQKNSSLVDCEEYMMNNKINDLLVFDNDNFYGIIQLYDIGSK